MNTEERELIDIDQLLERFKNTFTKGTIYQYCSRGEIPHYRLGKNLMFKEEEVDEWFSNRLKKIV
jgi:excisionase family DNA binding protein